MSHDLMMMLAIGIICIASGVWIFVNSRRRRPDYCRVPTPESWPAPPQIASSSQSRITADELNKRAEVESILLNVYAGKRPMLTREECKALAFRLGVPSEYQRPEWLLPLEAQS